MGASFSSQELAGAVQSPATPSLTYAFTSGNTKSLGFDATFMGVSSSGDAFGGKCLDI